MRLNETVQCFLQRLKTCVHLFSKNRHVIRPDASVWWIVVWKLSAGFDVLGIVGCQVGPSTSTSFNHTLLNTVFETGVLPVCCAEKLKRNTLSLVNSSLTLEVSEV